MMVLLTVLMRSGLPTWLGLNALSRRRLHTLLTLVIFSTGLASAVMLLVTPAAIKLSLQCATHRSEPPNFRIWEMGGRNDEYCATNKHPRSGL
jgi:Na+/H+ antiporter NhaD/arsenite permease-like protein